MKNKRILYIAIALCALLALGFATYKGLRFAMDKYHFLRDSIVQIDHNTADRVTKYDFDYSWMEDEKLVAHAFGGKGTKTYTNALEAFDYNYALGHKAFEVDFDLTEDYVAVCSHDEEWWRYITGNEDSDVEYTYENFKNAPLFTDYTPLDCRDIVDLLNEYPDIFIITDTKYSDELKVYQQFSQIVDYAKKVNPDVLDRIIPQFYTKQMLDYVMNVYPFRSVIFTLYQITWDADDIAKYCVKSGVKCITVSESLAEAETINLWKSMGIRVAVHTVNEKEEADSLIERGVDLIYTDFLEPESFEEAVNE